MLAVATVVAPTMARPTEFNLQPVGDVTTWPDAPYRWIDIADFHYADDYQDFFNYGQPVVTLSFCDISTTFDGTLTASGLKPNFAYQVKLVGKPTGLWGAGGDDWANEKIGYAGRWWRSRPDPGNADDADYAAHKDDPGYIYEGYLVFDFMVTNEHGGAGVTLSADSSFHVLWATHDSTGDGTGHRNPEPNDSAVRYYDFVASPAVTANAYDVDHGSGHVGIYAQWESGRALPGELVLPEGVYRCRFVLTEESFHQSGLDGGWAGAMGYDHLLFTIDHDVVPHCKGDFNCDGDVDGKDLAEYICADDIMSLADLAMNFGKSSCF